LDKQNPAAGEYEIATNILDVKKGWKMGIKL